MKKTLIIIVLFIITGLAAGVGYAMNTRARPVSVVKQPLANLPSSVTKTPQEHIGLPMSLTIEKINVEATVESVGLDSEKRMDVPKKVMNVAWYNLGPKPAEVGNAVIDGHVDTQTGAPAVFYNLKKLKTGDLLKIEDENGKQYTFKVTQIVQYQTNKFPIQEVFGATNKTRLNLITCSGIWDRAKKDYSDRTVVYSELVPIR